MTNRVHGCDHASAKLGERLVDAVHRERFRQARAVAVFGGDFLPAAAGREDMG